MAYRKANLLGDKRRRRSYRKSKSQIDARNALYEFDRREMNSLKVWLADNAWLLTGETEEEWHGTGEG